MRKQAKIMLVLAVILALMPMGSAFAAEQTVTPNGLVALSSGLTHVSASTYRAWASAQSILSDNLTISFTLYKKNGSTLTYITSNAASVTDGTNVETNRTVILNAGTYELDSKYTGNTQSDSDVKTFVIN